MALSDLWQIVNLPGIRAVARQAVHARDSEAPHRRHRYLRADPRRRHPAAPSVRVVRSGRPVRAAGRRRPESARDQGDALPHLGQELADRPRAAHGRRKRETSRGRHRAQGALRRREQHRLGEAARARRRARRLRLRQPEGARQDACWSCAKTRTACGATCTSAPATTTRRRRGSTPI